MHPNRLLVLYLENETIKKIEVLEPEGWGASPDY